MISTTTDTSAFDAMRHAMVASQLRTTAVNDQRVVAAMARVPREAFVPDAIRAIAYRDTALPLGGGRELNVPMATGRLLTQAELRSADRVLLIGGATGYTAAVLAEIVAHVTAVEVSADLVAAARAAPIDPARIEIVEGPLESGHAAGAPYDVLIVDGAVEALPDALVSQVRSGGRIVTGLVERGVTRLASGVKTDGGFGLVPFLDVDCVTLPGFARPKTFTF
jgi:protein-L-isoaspartate(D-aspartate) O-methyltransferase